MALEFLRKLRSSPTALSLLGANILVLLFALFLNWNVIDIMWIYVIQSVIIGFFNFLKMLRMSFSSGKVGDAIGGTFLSGFFLLHYGGFHAGYMVFLALFSLSGGAKSFTIAGGAVNGLIAHLAPILILGSAVFFLNHLYSFMFYMKKSKLEVKEGLKKFDKVMMGPYVRIIPMHLTIIFGGMFILAGAPFIALIIFSVLKTIVDLYMHLREHKDEINN